MRATLDLIEKAESTDHYRRVTATFSRLRRGRGFAHLNNPADHYRQDRLDVIAYLNHYEIVAIGIRKGILDDGTYREWISGTLVRDWNAIADFVQRERWKWNADTGQWIYTAPTFEAFQKLARNWSPDQAVDANEKMPPPASPAASGDSPLPEVESTEKSESVENSNH